jgi:hypothetical protein
VTEESSDTPEPDPRVSAWQALADELTPAKSLARIEAATTRVLGNVSLVGTLLTGAGLLAAGLPRAGNASTPLAVAAVVAAVLAVAAALTAQVLTVRRGVNTNNLVEVKAWYRSQFRRRAYTTRAATVLLLTAVLLAGGSALVAILDRGDGRLTLTVVESGTTPTAESPETTLLVEVAFRGLAAGTVATVLVTADTPDDSTVLAQGAVGSGGDGTASRTITVEGVPRTGTVEVSATGGGRQCRASIDLARAAPPVVECSDEA